MVDLGPLVVFFAINYFFGIMAGTAALMGATAVAIGVTYSVERSVPPIPAITCLFVIIFGGLTLVFDDELFIKIKPTVVNLLFAGALLAGLAIGRNLMKVMLGRMLRLTDHGWRILTRRWIGMFVLLAIINEAVWRNVETDTWVSFKAFGIPVLVLVFSLFLIPVIQRHQITGEDEN
ncbi:MAG: septation protein A [Rhodospirillaceae bacterium]|nr:septation protein A [Rhodospirillaceae bacterium]